MTVSDLLDVLFRWTHLIAGIMWIGNSMLFNWLDRNLEKQANLSRLSQGKIFMLHSGAFYDVEKKLLEPGEMPETLHWFKWQNFTTWASGISLLIVIYYMGKVPLVDPSIKDISNGVAVTLSVCVLFTAWLIYDGLWRTLGEKNPRLATGISIALLFGSIFAFTRIFSGPAAYMQTGVMIGTLMTGNVWMVIVPSQHALVDATKTGKEQDASLSIRAKQRSIHNNYLTFPLLFIMLSNHFPAATGHPLNWAVLIAVMIGGAGVRHFMNIRYRGGGKQLTKAAWLAPAFLMGMIGVSGLFVFTHIKVHTGPKVTGPVPFARAQEIIVQRCMRCHSSHPTDEIYKVAPNNIMFDTPDQIRLMKDRIYERAVNQRTMPLVNKTKITDMERAELGKWIDDGAKLE
ncbi:MAG TPA: urate hydroxylase PuuD [Kofleriaceae bacterium]|nr:urate hydroxylase PuuD [Kofleriaceae bacterium]